MQAICRTNKHDRAIHLLIIGNSEFACLQNNYTDCQMSFIKASVTLIMFSLVTSQKQKNSWKLPMILLPEFDPFM